MIKQILLGKQNTDQSRMLKKIQRDWPYIVGDSIASMSHPVTLTDNRLTINADSMPVQSDLLFLDSAIIRRVKNVLNINLSEIIVRG